MKYVRVHAGVSSEVQVAAEDYWKVLLDWPGIHTCFITVFIVCLYIGLWFVLPLTRRAKTRHPGSRDGGQ